ncbi:helix-turn-helix domain-containing protein [Larkinella sp. GY13]|uniref:helix-turn-helix domain-containing protein n=1 Tax=Larkinella sp. GY13 TaxID=3453720 RepID=UPI003EEDA2EE
MASFAQRLKLLMSQKGLKQVDLVRATGATRQAVNGWFTKGKLPSQDKLPLIAKVLGVTVDDLLKTEESTEKELPAAKDDSAEFWKNKYIQVLEEKNQLLEEKNKLLQKQSEEQAKTIERQKV